MTLIDEFYSLVHALRVHIEQEYPCLEPYEKTLAKPRALPPVAPKKIEKRIEPAPLPPPVSAPIAKKEVKKPEAAPKPIPTPTAQIPKVLQALNRPFIQPTRTPLGDCLLAFDKLGITHIQEPAELPSALVHELTFVSFFAPGSQEEQFIQKVVASVQGRLMPCRLYTQPDLLAAGCCHTLACQGASKALYLAYSQADSPKVSSWLSFFGDDIIDKKTLFATQVHELVLNASLIEDVEYKRTLWKELQRFV